MPKGMITRQPAKSGRHEGAKKNVAQTFVSAQKAKPARQPKDSALPGAAKKSAKAARAPKGFNPVAPERVQEILKRLDDRYGKVTCALTHSNAWELLVATILSAQCTDARVNMVTPVLFKKYPTPQAFAALEPEQLEPDIKSTGFFRNKSKSIVGAARKIVNDFGGKVPQTMAELLTVPGAARKTANVVLGSWFGIAEGVVVDTHVHRISRRLELTAADDPPKIEQDLMKVIPKDHWILFSHQVIHHGRSLCVARNPKCVECPLETVCHAEDKTWSTVEQHKGAK
ncbi:MAG TPA: endonuclease III [Terriglobales bacterium]|nr:endonuclease III [Terriglobales bacterium]